MGLLKGLGRAAKGLFGNPDTGDAFARAAAFMNDDYAGAARISQGMQANRRNRAKDAAEEAELKQAYATIDSDPDLSPLEKQIARLNIKEYSSNRLKALSPFESGSGGGSRGTKQADGTYKYNVAPRWDSDNNFYGASDGTKAPERLQAGTKTIPVTAGGEVRVVDSVTGQPINAPMKATGPIAGVIVNGKRFKGGDYRNPSNWEDVGGAGPQGPRTFR